MLTVCNQYKHILGELIFKACDVIYLKNGSVVGLETPGAAEEIWTVLALHGTGGKKPAEMERQGVN